MPALQAGLAALKSCGVDGVSVDVWWGVVEARGPRQYDWAAYRQLARMVAAAGLKLQVGLAFHACGCNVGDSCSVSLPPWVLAVAAANLEVFFTDAAGARSDEYLSLQVDSLPIFAGRSPVQMYGDFAAAFAREFAPQLAPGGLIPAVAISLGPAGELRYPSYPEGRWAFPGVGAFQCFDAYSRANLRAAALAAGRPEWGVPPSDAGSYGDRPEATGFFREQGGWQQPAGRFFLAWYAGALAAHGHRVLGACGAAMPGVRLVGKLPGVHWHFHTASHAAEATAGLFAPSHAALYAPLLAVFARHNAVLDFTCAEMRDAELAAASAACGPEALLTAVRVAAAAAGVAVAAENALPRFDGRALDQIVRTAYSSAPLPPLVSFSYLRMSERLFAPAHWHAFVAFARRMAAGAGRRGEEEEEVAPPPCEPYRAEGQRQLAAAARDAAASAPSLDALLRAALKAPAMAAR